MLNKLTKTTKKAKRVGRGYGSKKGGHTATRGQKGQKSRSGYKSPRKGFEGGSMPLSRRIPKLKGFSRGYFNSKVKNNILNLSDLNDNFNSGDTVDIESLVEKGLINISSKLTSIKILGKGDLTKKISIKGIPVSASVKDKVEAKGGKIEA